MPWYLTIPALIISGGSIWYGFRGLAKGYIVLKGQSYTIDQVPVFSLSVALYFCVAFCGIAAVIFPGWLTSHLSLGFVTLLGGLGMIGRIIGFFLIAWIATACFVIKRRKHW